MRRALSLLALGSTLFLAAAVNVPVLDLATIKATDAVAEDKDSFSFKGTLTGDSADDLAAYIADLAADGVAVGITDGDSLATDVYFDSDECKLLNNGNLICKTTGASLRFNKFVSSSWVSTVAKEPKTDKTKVTETYYKVSGTAHGLEFGDVAPMVDPLAITLASDNTVDVVATNGDCTDKTLKNGRQTLTCVPVVVA